MMLKLFKLISFELISIKIRTRIVLMSRHCNDNHETDNFVFLNPSIKLEGIKQCDQMTGGLKTGNLGKKNLPNELRLTTILRVKYSTIVCGNVIVQI